MANERPVKAMRTGRPLLRYHYVSRKTFDYFVEMVQYRYDQASSDTVAMGTVSTITLLRVIVDTTLAKHAFAAKHNTSNVVFNQQ